MGDVFMREWQERSEHRHAEEVAAGRHDSQCEFGYRITKRLNGGEGVTFMHMCNCRMRQRVSEGFTETPGPLIVQHPLCPRDCTEVEFDGDSWVCPKCGVHWSSSDEADPGHFVDDYGDPGRPLTPEERAALRSARADDDTDAGSTPPPGPAVRPEADEKATS